MFACPVVLRATLPLRAATTARPDAGWFQRLVPGRTRVHGESPGPIGTALQASPGPQWLKIAFFGARLAPGGGHHVTWRARRPVGRTPPGSPSLVRPKERPNERWDVRYAMFPTCQIRVLVGVLVRRCTAPAAPRPNRIALDGLFPLPYVGKSDLLSRGVSDPPVSPPHAPPPKTFQNVKKSALSSRRETPPRPIRSVAEASPALARACWWRPRPPEPYFD